MSRLYGFKFVYRGYARTRCIILETTTENRNYVLIKDSNCNSAYTVDITDKVDTICKKMTQMNINEWNFQTFDYPWQWFPNFHWDLSISADGINVVCGGLNNYPEDWNCFTAIMQEAGVKIL